MDGGKIIFEVILSNSKISFQKKTKTTVREREKLGKLLIFDDGGIGWQKPQKSKP